MARRGSGAGNRQTSRWICYGCGSLSSLPPPTQPTFAFQVPTLHIEDGEPRPFCDLFCYVGWLYDSENPDAEEPSADES